MKDHNKTAALYARFSSDLQKDISIDDQNALCERYAAREGIKVVAKFSDRAKSGSSLFDRDQLLELMLAAKARKFDAIVVESLDRLSRDQADLAGLFKKLKFYGVDLLTVNEGQTTDMHVGIRGIVGAMYLKDLGDKVRRHHFGRAREGKVMGLVTYGYCSIAGRPGEREVDPERAAIVRRIFGEYARGISPRDIALGLARDGIPSPNGAKAWSHQSFMGGGGKSGIIGNRMYVGELIYNQYRTVRDPETGSFSNRANAESERITTAVPHLRIIDQSLWDAAQGLRASRAAIRAGKATTAHRRGAARPDHLLSGLLRCGACNGHMIFTSTSRGRRFAACAAARTKSACEHRKAYDVDLLKRIVIDNFRERLIDPRLHIEAMRTYHAEYAALGKKNSTDKIAAEKQIGRLTVQITRLVDAIADGVGDPKELVASMRAKEAERVALTERVRLLKADNFITLHPHVVDAYAKNIETLHAALSADIVDPEVVHAFRNLMDCIVVVPTAYRAGYVIDVYGRVPAIMGINLFPTMRSAEEILTSEGVSSAVINTTARGQVQRGNTWR
jgi:site-specific DNA recombinase